MLSQVSLIVISPIKRPIRSEVCDLDAFERCVDNFLSWRVKSTCYNTILSILEYRTAFIHNLSFDLGICS